MIIAVTRFAHILLKRYQILMLISVAMASRKTVGNYTTAIKIKP